MAVDINEAGRDKEALGIYARHTFPFFDCPNVVDSAVSDCYVCTERWGCRTINNSPIVNQQISLYLFVPYLAVHPRSIVQSAPVIAPATSEQR